MTRSRKPASTPKKGRKPKVEVLPAPALPSSQKDLDSEADESSDAPSSSDTEWEIDETPEPELSAHPLPPAGISETDLIAISSADPLRRYLDEIRRYPLLEPEEEFELAMRLRNAGDLQAAKILVSANLRLVVKIAFEYRTLQSNILDLIQEGNIGLMKAVSKFDPTKGARLGYYASWWIRSYILKYLIDNFRLVRIGTTQSQKKLFYHLMREKQRLEAQGLLAGPKLLAEKLNVREKDVLEMEQRLSSGGAETSLDAPLYSDSEGNKNLSAIHALADERESVDEQLAREELLRLLRERLPEFRKQLNEKELQVLNDRLIAEEPKTLQEIADLYGLTRERARQIEARVITKLRDFLKSTIQL